MSVVVAVAVGVVSALIATELWGFAPAIARGIVRVFTSPLDAQWRTVRRAELDALADPCAGEHRLSAIARVLLVTSRLVVHDVAVGRTRKPHLGRVSVRRREGSDSARDVAAEHRHLLDALVRHGVQFVVVGGVAAQLRGWTGSTANLDIVLADGEGNAARVNRALAEIGVTRVDYTGLGTNFETPWGQLKHVRRADGIGRYDDWFRGANQVTLGDETIVVAAAEDIVRSKECSDREADHAALPAMRRALKLDG